MIHKASRLYTPLGPWSPVDPVSGGVVHKRKKNQDLNGPYGQSAVPYPTVM